MLAHGEQSEAPRRRWKPGQEQHPEPKNQDSQHMQNQPRGSFPDLEGFFRRVLKINLRKQEEFSKQKAKGLLMVVSKRWFEFSGGTKFRYPPFTSIEPPFYLNFTSL